MDDDISHLLDTCRTACAIVAAQKDAFHELDDMLGAASLALAAVIPSLSRIKSVDDYIYILATNAAKRYLKQQKRCWPPRGYDPAHPGRKDATLYGLLSRYKVDEPAHLERLTAAELNRQTREWMDELHACCNDAVDRQIVDRLASGDKVAEVAANLAISPMTVARRREAIRYRLGKRLDCKRFSPFVSDSMWVLGVESTLYIGGLDEPH